MLHIKQLICARIPIPKERLAVFTNYPSVTKDQTLEETVLNFFHPVIHGCFQPIGVTIEDTIACHDVIKGELSKGELEGLVHTKLTATKPSLFDLMLNQKYYLYIYSLLKIFCAFNFYCAPPVTKNF